MNAIRHYVITNPARAHAPARDASSADDFSAIRPNHEAGLAAAVADRRPDARADVAGLLRSDAGGLVGVLAGRSRRFPSGAVVYWRVNAATGQAEGWVVPVRLFDRHDRAGSVRVEIQQARQGDPVAGDRLTEQNGGMH